MTAAVHIEVDRPLCVNGERVEVGTVLKLPALAAADALRSGRVHLVYPDDAVAVMQADRADVLLQLKRAGGPPQPAPREGWPWQPHSSRPLP
jgi:hypothetical protein